MSDDVYIATKTAIIYIDGRRTTVRKGLTRVRAGHPVLSDHPELFKPIDVHFDVEQATAAPGEKRSTRRRRKTDDDDG